MELDSVVSANNKEIWDRSWFEFAFPSELDGKKWRLDNFDRAHQRLTDMNDAFNANAAGKTVEQYKADFRKYADKDSRPV